VFEHLQTCPRCETLARELESSGDDLMDHLRAAGRCGLEDSRPSWLSRVQSAVPDADGSGWRQPDPISDEVPSVLGAYELQEVIGCGGMGVVYRAVHQRLGKPVAVKLMAARAAPAAAARFEREMRAVGRLDHPAIVRATDAGSAEGRLFLAMELIDGVDLRRLLHHRGPLPVADACEIVRQAAIGLQAAHQAGVVHRDMKPSNLMLNRDGQVKILDFGLAATEAADGGITHATSVGQVLGTLDYLAPEQVDGEAVDGRADVYALGATLFTLLAGRPPLGGEPDMPLLRRLRRLALEDPPRLSELRPEVPEPLDALVAQMLARDPAARVGSAAEVAQRLDSLAAGHDLAGLAQRAIFAASSDSAALSDVGFAPHIGLVRPASDDRRQHAVSQATARPVGTPWSGRLTRVLLALALLGGGIWWGIVILLETPQGTLRIESEVGQMHIEILDTQDRVQELQIDRGDNETTLRAGQYRLRLAGEHDAVAISPSTITLRKGEQQVARITRLDAAPAEPPVAEVPPRPERLYQGTPESAWQRQLESELAPLSKLEAAQALVVLAGKLPAERWIDRMLEIGGILVEAGWGEKAYRLPVDHFVHIPDDRGGYRSPIQRAPAWGGIIGRITGPEPVSDAWNSLRSLIGQQQRLLAIPPMLLAERFGAALTTGDAPVSAFAASLILESGIGRAILQDPAAVRSVIDRLDDATERFEQEALSTLVAAWLYEAAADQDQQKVETRMNDLGERLLEDPSSELHAEVADAWLAVTRRIHLHRISDESTPSASAVDATLAARLVYQRLVATDFTLYRWFEARSFDSRPPYRTTGPVNLRRNSGFFLHEWISVINQRLADEALDAAAYSAILRSLVYVLRSRMPDDLWDVDTTAELLTRRIRQAWMEEETPFSLAPDTPSLTSTGLLGLVYIQGALPDFVRSAPPWMETWEQLLSTDVWQRLRSVDQSSRLKVLYSHSEKELTPLGQIAPYQAVQWAVSQQNLGLSILEVLSLLWGADRPRHPPTPDALLLLSILSELGGEDEKIDRQIGTVLINQPVSTDLKEILAGSTALRPIARDLLTKIGERDLDPLLREVLRSTDDGSSLRPQPRGR
jgi:serine/threonine protein kinase